MGCTVLAGAVRVVPVPLPAAPGEAAVPLAGTGAAHRAAQEGRQNQ